MKKQPLFVGSAVAICTPFHKDAIDYEKLEELLQFQLDRNRCHCHLRHHRRPSTNDTERACAVHRAHHPVISITVFP